jgi:NTP pyrophosphatase (non-canonical NTP hydrolase)
MTWDKENEMSDKLRDKLLDFIALPSMEERLSELQKMAHETAKKKGWWDGGHRNMGEQVANFHAEISEAWEEFRNGRLPDEVYFRDDGKPEGFAIELADLLIRVMDTAEAYGIDLTKAVLLKMAYNEKRPYRHGGKKA